MTGGRRRVARSVRRGMAGAARRAGRLVRMTAPVVPTEAADPTGPEDGTAAADPTARLRTALALVAEVEQAEDVLPRRDEEVPFLARARVVRRPGLDARGLNLVPAGQRGGWQPGAAGLRTLGAPVAADLVVLGKFDLQELPKLRAVYPSQGLTLVVQPPTPSSGSGVRRAVRAHEVVERHAPELIPQMVGHGVLGGGTQYLVERWVPGRPLNGARRLSAAAPRILAGLAAVHRGYGVGRVLLSDHWGGALLDRWRQTVQAGVVPGELARWTEELIDRDGTLRVSFIHGDLVASNVLATDTGVVLVDWEQAHQGVLMNDAAKLHLFGADPEALLEVILATLGDPADVAVTSGAAAAAPPGTGGTPYLPLEELALCHAQLIGRYPRRSAGLVGHPRAEAYERQVRRQVERLELVRRRWA